MKNGKKNWVFCDGDLPPHGDNPEFLGHEALMITNVSKKDAKIRIKIIFEDKAPYDKITIDLPAERTGCFRIDSFDQFKGWFYRTDHHWNAAGSLEGYRQVLSLLKPQETALVPREEVTLKGQLTGSKATGALAAFSEDMTVYRYDYPEMTVTVNGAPAEDYGNQQAYLSGEGGTPTYGKFYGSDNGETTFDTGTQGRGNLLVVGESFDNAILKLLASHYDKTFSVDLRYYEAHLDIPFDLDAYLAEHAIDTVLLIGNIDYFVMEEFMLGGAEHGIQ